MPVFSPSHRYRSIPSLSQLAKCSIFLHLAEQIQTHTQCVENYGGYRL